MKNVGVYHNESILVNWLLSFYQRLSILTCRTSVKQLDDSMKKTGLFYARFMDDWIVIAAPTRWKLRSAVRIVNETLNVLKVEQHLDILKPVWFFKKPNFGCSYTRAKLFLDCSKNNFEMSTRRL